MVNEQKQGMLSAIERLSGSRFLCRCDCGNTRIVKVGHFRSGKIKSCGCHVVRHGHSGYPNKKSRTYISYHNMIARCHKPTNKRYKDYGARGITVCPRWLESFSNFLTDMGPCPDGYVIERLDNRLGYEPGNCAWVTRQQNQRNRDVSRIWIVNERHFETSIEAARAFAVCTQTILSWCQGRKTASRYYPPRPNCGVIYKYPQL